MPSSRLIPLTEWNNHHVWPTISGLRHYVLHADRYGFTNCIRRVGRRVLIVEDAFHEWVEQMNAQATS